MTGAFCCYRNECNFYTTDER